MVDVGMYPAIAYQSHKVNRLIVSFSIVESLFQHRLFPEAVVGNRQIYLCEILIYNAPGTEVHMSHLAVAHLPFGKANIHSVGAQGAVRIFCIK